MLRLTKSLIRLMGKGRKKDEGRVFVNGKET